LEPRYAESTNRAKSIKKYQNKDSYFNNHNSLPNCKVATPIVDMSDDEVWEFLMENKPLWDKDNMELFTLYKDAHGGECPTILSKNESPSCGSTSPRFGCWTCTVVNKDKSLEGLIDSGFKEFEKLANFRNWLISIRSDKRRRMRFNRQGNVRKRNDKLVHGPFTLNTRKEILKKLCKLQKELNMELITKDEIFYIKKQWKDDSLMIDLIQGE
jgi:DNA sulfur modification protein DndC